MNIYTSKTEFLEAENKRLHTLNQELLEALKDTTDNMIEWGEMCSADEQERYGLRSDILVARAAIAKATGAQP